MPGNWLEVDSKLPVYSREESLDVLIKKLYDYQMILAEQLRYGLQNLGTANWNKADLDKFSEASTAKISKQLETLSKTVLGLSNSLSSIGGKISTLESSSSEQGKKIREIETNFNNISNGMEQLTLELGSVQQNISGIHTNLEQLKTRMAAAEAAIKELQGGRK